MATCAPAVQAPVRTNSYLNPQILNHPNINNKVTKVGLAAVGLGLLYLGYKNQSLAFAAGSLASFGLVYHLNNLSSQKPKEEEVKVDADDALNAQVVEEEPKEENELPRQAPTLSIRVNAEINHNKLATQKDALVPALEPKVQPQPVTNKVEAELDLLMTRKKDHTEAEVEEKKDELPKARAVPSSFTPSSSYRIQERPAQLEELIRQGNFVLDQRALPSTNENRKVVELPNTLSNLNFA